MKGFLDYEMNSSNISTTKRLLKQAYIYYEKDTRWKMRQDAFISPSERFKILVGFALGYSHICEIFLHEVNKYKYIYFFCRRG